MRTPTHAETALLGLLAEAPRYGYELDQLIEQRGMRAWTEIGFSSIYFLLSKLERVGWVTSQVSPGTRGPGRKTFTLTPAGHGALAEAAGHLLADPSRAWPFLLGLANAPALDDAALRGAIAEREAALERAAGEIEEAAGRADDAWFVTELFDHARAMLQAEAAWVAAFAGRLESAAALPTTPPPKASPLRANQPRLAELPRLTMAVVRSIGDPDEVGPTVFPRLYGSVYPLKFRLKKEGVAFAVAPVRARWGLGPEDAAKPRAEWVADWAIPVPDGTTALPHKPGVEPAAVEVWEYGTVAEILHVGPYSAEGPTIATLHAFIEEAGYRIAGRHEEEYLTRPGSARPRTVIRYPVRPRG